MTQQQPFQPVAIVRATATSDLPEMHIRRGDTIYLARDSHSHDFRVVRWQRTRWECSCGQPKCGHTLAANEFLFVATQAERATGEDLAAHVGDEARDAAPCPALSKADQVVQRIRNAGTPKRQQEDW